MRSRTLFASLSVLLLLFGFLLDVLTPVGLVVGIVLSIPVALSAFAMSRAFPLWLIGAALVANVIAGVTNALAEGGVNSVALANRALSMLAVVVVGVLALQLREVSARAERLSLREKRASEDRMVRDLTERLNGPLTPQEFLERASVGLREAMSAETVTIQGQQERAAHTDLSPHVRQGTLSSKWQRAGQPDLWVSLVGAREGEALLGKLIAALEPLLEQVTLLEDLRRERVELQRRNDVIRDLVYAFSHDLRTPLMANVMSMKLALQGAYGALPEEYRRSLENGLAANHDLLDLADKLLLVAKLESGELSEDRAAVDLRDLVLNRAREMRPTIEVRGLRLDVQLESRTRVRANAAELRRVVQNLLENAAKFSPPGGSVQVVLQTEGREAQLLVVDEGRGVSPEMERRLFQRFRGSGAGAGSGLGLYLSRSIARAHGGQLTYRRTTDAKTVFELKLPLAQEGDERE